MPREREYPFDSVVGMCFLVLIQFSLYLISYLEDDGNDISIQYLPHMQNHQHYRIYIPRAVVTRTSYRYTFFHPYSGTHTCVYVENFVKIFNFNFCLE